MRRPAAPSSGRHPSLAGHSEDVAVGVLFLASPQASFITGETVIVGAASSWATRLARISQVESVRRCIMAQETSSNEKLRFCPMT